jgi:hypothetical protein
MVSADTTPQVVWGLDPRYQPPAGDSGIVLRFMGNTARVTACEFIGQVDSGQMRAAAGWLVDQAAKIDALAERRSDALKIQVGHRLPDQTPPRLP